MKRTVIIATLLLVATLGVKAQDTLESNITPGNYFCNHVIDYDSFMPNDILCDFGVELIAKYNYTDTTLRVYGIAACLEVMSNMFWDIAYQYTLDTSHELAFEKVALYKAYPDTLLPITEEIPINVFDSIPALYMKFRTTFGDSRAENKYYVKPFYEVYFEKPVEVQDSFYVGVSSSNDKVWDYVVDTNGVSHLVWHYSHFPVGPSCFQAVTWMGYFPLEEIDRYALQGAAMEISWGETMSRYYNQYPGWILMYPILTPRPDTTQAGPVDTLDVAEVLLERYVSLLPNPATDRVQVVSSFGLQGVEVYDAAGAKVLERSLSDYAATFDVSALPAGTYMVRVRTPKGVATKKLLVSR